MRRLLILVSLVLGAVSIGGGMASAAPPAGERLALLIGIDHHQGTTRTNLGANGDVEDMRAALITAGWPVGNIKVLTDQAATAAGIREGLRWLASRSTDTSFSVVHYSGHVLQRGSTEYFWPHDNAHIPDTEIADNLRAVKGWMWFDVSGCEAAGFDVALAGPKRLVTASSQSNEKSYEYPAGVRNSVFTSLLVEKGLSGKLADANRDGKTSIQEAFHYAAARAPQITANESQGPQHPYMAGGDGSDWFLAGVAAKAAPVAFARSCWICF